MKVNGEEDHRLSRLPERKIKPLWRRNRTNSHDKLQRFNSRPSDPSSATPVLPTSMVERGTAEPPKDLPWLCRATVSHSVLVPSIGSVASWLFAGPHI